MDGDTEWESMIPLHSVRFGKKIKMGIQFPQSKEIDPPDKESNFQ